MAGTPRHNPSKDFGTITREQYNAARDAEKAKDVKVVTTKTITATKMS